MLYEVITSVNRLGVGRILPGMEGAELFSGGRLFDRRVLGSSLVQGEGIVCQLFSDSVFCDYRITSYNVCYTKLLRILGLVVYR